MTMTNYFNKMVTLAERIMVLLASDNDVDPTIFTKSFSESMSVLRLLHNSPEVFDK